jgi:uncharacterized Fe-S cluster protein YjdI
MRKRYLWSKKPVMEDVVKKYTNGEVTIVWKPSACVHSTICFANLPTVFSPSKRPWVNAAGASTERIIEVVRRCPSGALTFHMNREAENTGETKKTEEKDAETKVQVMKNGPLLVFGSILVKDSEGNEMKKSNVTSFCRCGLSKTNPYCDGSHINSKFKG